MAFELFIKKHTGRTSSSYLSVHRNRVLYIPKGAIAEQYRFAQVYVDRERRRIALKLLTEQDEHAYPFRTVRNGARILCLRAVLRENPLPEYLRPNNRLRLTPVETEQHGVLNVLEPIHEADACEHPPEDTEHLSAV